MHNTDNSQNTHKPSVIHVISCGIQGPLSAQCQDYLQSADVVFASRRLLECYLQGAEHKAEQRIIAAHARDNAMEALELAKQGRKIVVLASGDALYHGFGATLCRALEHMQATMPSAALPELAFHPHITALQYLFHHLGMPWSDAELCSAHDGGPLPLRHYAESPFCVIYAGSRHNAADIAKALVDFLPECADRPAIIAQNVGSSAQNAKENIERGTLAKLSTSPCHPTSILVLLPHASCHSLPLPLGLPETLYERENNLITASDARAIILSRLRLPSQGLMWDMGAGSGSVGLEAAAMRPRLTVLAVERQAHRCAMIKANAQRLGITNHSCIEGHALDCIATLQGRPDRIFIGGGGRDLPAILDLCIKRLAPNGLLVVSSVSLESFHMLYAWRCDLRRDLSTLSVAREHCIAGAYHHMRQQNSISLFTFSK